MMGIAVGIAITATVLSIIEKSPLMPWLVGVMWLAVVGIVLAVLPIANSLTLTPEGFRVRVLGFLGGSVAWSEVEAVEAGEGWAGAAVVVHLREGAAARSFPGLRAIRRSASRRWSTTTAAIRRNSPARWNAAVVPPRVREARIRHP